MTLQAFRSTLDVFVREMNEKGLAAFHRAAEGEMRRVVEAQRQRAGIPPATTVIADGVRHAPISSAKKIVVIEYRYWQEIVSEAIRFFEGRAPRRTGAYLGSVRVFVDGSLVQPNKIPENFAEITISPTVLYSRRLEVGKRKDGRPYVVQVPPRIVDAVTVMLRKKYGRAANFKTEFRRLEGESSIRARGLRRNRRAKRSRGGEMTYPSIVITPL